jgi:MarR family transcriptional repressor of emrRAB
MTHASREANLLGALSLAVAERMDVATRAAAGQGGSAPAALAALGTYLEGSTIDGLRRPLGLTHSAAVRLVDRLVAAGQARREAGEDGRSVAIFLTATGRRAAARIHNDRMRALAEVLAPLDENERDDLSRLAGRLLGAVTTGREAARHLCRLCDPDACGHYDGRCPVTLAVDEAEAGRAVAP